MSVFIIDVHAGVSTSAESRGVWYPTEHIAREMLGDKIR